MLAFCEVCLLEESDVWVAVLQTGKDKCSFLVGSHSLDVPLKDAERVRGLMSGYWMSLLH